MGRSPVVSFFFPYLHLLKLLYSGGLHRSIYGGPLHYTVFGFCEHGGALKQRWAMHIDDDGSSKYVGSTKRVISWKDITPVRKTVT